MPTINGSWKASDRVRINLVYSTGGNTSSGRNITATAQLQTRYSLYDSVNGYSISGGLGSTSGSNRNYSHGNSGGTTTITSISRVVTGNVTVTVTVTGLEAYGTITQQFTVPVSWTPPVTTRSVTSFEAQSITQTSFRTKLNSYSGGGTGTNIQVMYNTTASATGASTRSAGEWNNVTVPNLAPQTRYYFRMRLQNNAGWGPWSSWQTVTTLPSCFVRSGGVWRAAIPYVRHNGSWKQARPYVRSSGSWRG